MRLMLREEKTTHDPPNTHKEFNAFEKQRRNTYFSYKVNKKRSVNSYKAAL